MHSTLQLHKNPQSPADFHTESDNMNNPKNKLFRKPINIELQLKQHPSKKDHWVADSEATKNFIQFFGDNKESLTLEDINKIFNIKFQVKLDVHPEPLTSEFFTVGDFMLWCNRNSRRTCGLKRHPSAPHHFYNPVIAGNFTTANEKLLGLIEENHPLIKGNSDKNDK